MPSKNLIQKFQFEERPVRTITRNNEYWFVAKDVCDVLGIENSRDTVKNLEKEEVSNVDNTDIKDFSVPNRGLTIVSESGLYALIFKSRKPEARKFRVWVTKEVLPTLRKQGTYTMPEWKKKTTTIQSRFAFFNRPDCAALLAELNRAGENKLITTADFRRIVFNSAKKLDEAPVHHYLIDRFFETNLIPERGFFETTKDVHARYLECTHNEISRNKLTRYLVTHHPDIYVKQKKINGYPEQVYQNVKLIKEPVKPALRIVE